MEIEAGIRKAENSIEAAQPQSLESFRQVEIDNGWVGTDRVTQPAWADAWLDYIVDGVRRLTFEGGGVALDDQTRLYFIVEELQKSLGVMEPIV